jgi:hypothetical protein
MKIGIVTGAASGMGREFACQVQNSYPMDEIWLIDRQEEQLKETVKLIKNVKAVAIALDLSKEDDLKSLSDMIVKAAPEITILNNNAGFSYICPFTDASLQRTMNMIDVNVKAVTAIVHMCLPCMKKGSVIFQVASLNAFLPAPNGAAYSGTKAYVLAFSQALYQELKNKGIHVMTISPGPVRTNFMKVASDGKIPDLNNAVDARDVVRTALQDAKAGKLNSTFGFINRLNIFLTRILSRKTLLGMS